ncbi:alpha/beta-hydrolase [Agrocybe pediades]|nr:alpha/beta-hydrolase [Agrocybe pediades]
MAQRLPSPESQLVSIPTGVSLQTDLWQPSHPAGDNNKLAVLLHPWSWLGGRKEDPVLSCLLGPLISQGYHVVRYNSRGVGGSTGWASFTGFKETKDLEALVTWAMDLISNVQRVVIIGYSHGSLIASLHPLIPSVKTSHVLLSYPLGPRGWLTLFHSSTYTTTLKELIQQPDSNVLIILGDCDEFTAHSKYSSWVSEFGDAKNVKIEEVKDATHFWQGESGRKLIDIVREWTA